MQDSEIESPDARELFSCCVIICKIFLQDFWGVPEVHLLLVLYIKMFFVLFPFWMVSRVYHRGQTSKSNQAKQYFKSG